MPDDDTGRIGTVSPCPTGGCPVPDNVAGTHLDFEFGVSPLTVTPLAGRTNTCPASVADCPTPPTVLGSFAVAFVKLPDLADPVDFYVWRETFLKHARRADAALADFNHELDTRICPADALRASCANLKDSCIKLHTAVTANSSNLAPLITLMSQTHARVLNLEVDTAKNAADVATTMTALVATPTAHATTAETVAGFSNAVDDHVGRHIGSLKSVVSSLGHDVLALRNILTNMHGDPPPPTALPPGAPATDDTIAAVAAVPPLLPPAAADMPTPADDGMMMPTSKLFPHVDSSNLRVDAAQNERFHANPVDHRLPTGGRHDNEVAPSDGDQWAPRYSQRAPPPI